jgi:hypothetical protein
VFGRLSALAAVISLFLVAVAHGATTDTASATASPGTYVVNEPITFTSTTPCTVLCSQIWTFLDGSRLGDKIGEGESVQMSFTAGCAPTTGHRKTHHH